MSNNFNVRSLGPLEASIVLTLVENGASVTDAREITSIVGNQIQARSAVKRLIAKGWLTRLGGRRYAIVPPNYGAENIGDYNTLALASMAETPSYIGWWSAAAHHSFTTQVPMIIHVATTRQLPDRLINDTKIEFHRLHPRKFFGMQEVVSFGRTLRVSDREKTVLDCVDRLDLCGGPSEAVRIVFTAAPHLDFDKLLRDARRMESVSLLQRLGFFLDIAEVTELSTIRDKLREDIPKSARSRIGGLERCEGDIGYVPNWNLNVNITQSQLLGNLPFGTATRRMPA